MLDSSKIDAAFGDVVEIFSVYEEIEDGEDVAERPIGRVEVDEYGYLAIAEADPARASFLRRFVERLNSKPMLVLTSEEPAERPFATGEVIFRRRDPEFIGELCTYARTYYGLRLL